MVFSHMANGPGQHENQFLTTQVSPSAGLHVLLCLVAAVSFSDAATASVWVQI